MKTFIEFLKESFNCNKSIVELHWREINKTSFDSKLNPPKISVLDQPEMNALVKGATDDIMGFCDAKNIDAIKLYFSSDIKNIIELTEIVAHEMVHQYIAQEHGYHEMRLAEHGPRFMRYSPWIKKYKNTKLIGTHIDEA